MRKVVGSLAFAVLLAGLSTGCFAKEPTVAEVEAKYSKILRGTKITSIKPAPVEGLYEIVAGPNVFYFSPDKQGFLIFGNIIDETGKNLTGEIQQSVRAKFQKEAEKVAAEKLKTLPLDKAVKVGSGPNVVIEFTDPDCPYCRKVDQFLSKRTDITRYTFLNPIDSLHPNARAKSIFVLASKDQVKALEDVFAGKYDQSLPLSNADLSKHPAEVKQLADGMKIGQEMGVQGTPMLFVNGTMVNGADLNKIGQLLKK